VTPNSVVAVVVVDFVSVFCASLPFSLSSTMYFYTQGKESAINAESGGEVGGTQEETSCVFTPVTTPTSKGQRVGAPGYQQDGAILSRGPPNIKESHRKWKVAHGKEFWEKKLSCKKRSSSPKGKAIRSTKMKISQVLYQSIQRAREVNPWDYFVTQAVEECRESEPVKQAALSDLGNEDELYHGEADDNVVGVIFESSIKRRLDFMFEDLDEESDESDEDMDYNKE